MRKPPLNTEYGKLILSPGVWLVDSGLFSVVVLELFVLVSSYQRLNEI